VYDWRWLPHAGYSWRMIDFAARYERFRRRDPALDGIVFIAVNRLLRKSPPYICLA
jgi:hypothetical protein